MKNAYFILSFLLTCILFIFACKEDPVEDPIHLNPTPTDTVQTDTTTVDTTSVVILTADLFVEESPEIEMNPSGRVPLSAILTYSTFAPSAIEVQIISDEPFNYIISEFDTVHTTNLYGLIADMDNEVLLIATNAQGQKDSLFFNVQTDPLPSWFPEITIHTLNRAEMEPGWHLSDFSYHSLPGMNTVPFIFDDQTRIRWYLDLYDYNKFSASIQRMQNGNFLIGQTWSIAEYDKMGFLIQEWSLVGFTQHHEAIEKSNGNILVAVDKIGASTIEDYIIELDRTTGAIVNEWDLRQSLDPNRTAYSTNSVDWLHTNAIWYSEADDCIIVSGRSQCVAKITSNNELVWILAPHLGWGNAGPNGDLHDTNDYLLTAVNSSGQPYAQDIQDGTATIDEFDWPWGQHSVMIHPDNGNILVFDNGSNRNFIAGTNFSRGAEFQVDEANMTVSEVWEFGESLGSDFVSRIMSDIDILPLTQNRLLAPAVILTPTRRARIIETSYPDNTILFDAEILLNETSPNWSDYDFQYRAERIEL